MRILVVGDIHLCYELPYSTPISDGRRAEWEAVKQKIIDTAQTCDAVVFLGDFFNARHNHSSVLKEAIDLLRALGKKEIHIISGNHCRYGKNTALDFLQRLNHPNWHIHTEPRLTAVGGVSAMMVPFMTPALLGTENNKEGAKELLKIMTPAKLAFAHHAIEGSLVRGEKMDLSVDFFNEIILNRKELEDRFETVFAGHVHSKQRLGEKIIIAGNVFTHAVGQHEKSIWIWEDGKVEEIPLPVRGIYKIIWEEDVWVTEDAMIFNPKKEDVPPLGSIVKCYVTNKKTNISHVKEFLSQFDAYLLVEQYPNERAKAHFEGGTLDLSVEGLLKLYADEKGLSYSELNEGWELIK